MRACLWIGIARQAIVRCRRASIPVLLQALREGRWRRRVAREPRGTPPLPPSSEDLPRTASQPGRIGPPQRAKNKHSYVKRPAWRCAWRDRPGWPLTSCRRSCAYGLDLEVATDLESSARGLSLVIPESQVNGTDETFGRL